jgi:uncharacterized protein
LNKRQDWAILYNMIDLAALKPKISDVCKKLPVRRLGIFGSALTNDFGPASDVDVLVVFDADTRIDLFEKYFDLKERLEEVMGRKVDLVVDRPFRNPFFSDSVQKTRTVVYER